MTKAKGSPFFALLATLGEACEALGQQSAEQIRLGTVNVLKGQNVLQKAQTALGELESVLLTAFVTPLDRKDLCRLGQKAYGFARATVWLPAALPAPLYRQQTANWVAQAGGATKNLLADFANFKKYAILQKSIRLLRQSGLRGLQLWGQGASFCGEPFWGNLRLAADAAFSLADCAAEALIVNL